MTSSQLHLTRAALADGEAAVAAWAAWRKADDYDRIDPASARLLPLVRRNLQRAGAGDDPLFKRMAGYARLAWLKNQVLLAETARLLQPSPSSCMVTGGLALAAAFYPSADLRPVFDADLLIPRKHAPDWFSRLRTMGWSPPSARAEAHYQVVPRIAYRHEKQRVWCCLRLCPVPEIPFVERATANTERSLPACQQTKPHLWTAWATVPHGGHSLPIPSPTALLLESLLNGARWHPVTACTWVTDAAAILRSGREVDWVALHEVCDQHKLGLMVLASLRVLRDAFGLPIPEETIEFLGQRTPDSFERREAAWKARNYHRQSWAWPIRQSFDYVRWCRASGQGGSLAVFARFLRETARGVGPARFTLGGRQC